MRGMQFGKLTVIDAAGLMPNGSRYVRAWLCQCDCGRERVATETELKRGRITHCDRRRFIPRGPEYMSYSGMKARCYQKSHKDFHNYGGRGIAVCKRWINGENCETGFELFLRDMGAKPTDKHSIDRMDSNGNYAPSNCRWATETEQANNRRSQRTIEIEGERITLTEASERYGIKSSVIRDRIDRYAMTPLEAVTRAPRKMKVYAPRER